MDIGGLLFRSLLSSIIRILSIVGTYLTEFCLPYFFFVIVGPFSSLVGTDDAPGRPEFLRDRTMEPNSPW